jgi:hypothetical protein
LNWALEACFLSSEICVKAVSIWNFESYIW